ncbi:MAG: hypothetical protein JW751_19710 [Polyangiaceae bacterium]|nr:hypothetical protein [Polyangiaceae bacterium]
MTYRPTEEAFGPPFLVWIPSILYVLLAATAIVLVAMGQASPHGSTLHRYVVEQNAVRFISAQSFAVILAISAVASVLRTGMRGVRLRGEGVEYRDVVSMLWPQVKRYRWAQIDRLLLDQPGIVVLELWDGSRVMLPSVWNHDRLLVALEKVALARAIPVQGARGVDEIPDPEEYDPA